MILLAAAAATTRIAFFGNACSVSQFRRWGWWKGAPDYAGIVNRYDWRHDIYLEANEATIRFWLISGQPKGRRDSRFTYVRLS